MKLHTACLLGFVLGFATLVATAQNPPSYIDLYDNGPVNGQVDGWNIANGYAVSNSVEVTGQVTGLQFYAWLIPGDTVTNVQVTFGTQPFDSDIYSAMLSASQGPCATNNYGFSVCEETLSLTRGPTLNGLAWLTLENATVSNDDNAYWDENSGIGCTSPGCPSQAEGNLVGTIPSEAFTVLGGDSTTSTSTTTTGTTPEPASILLLGSGILCLTTLLRRRRL